MNVQKKHAVSKKQIKKLSITPTDDNKNNSKNKANISDETPGKNPALMMRRKEIITNGSRNQCSEGRQQWRQGTR